MLVNIHSLLIFLSFAVYQLQLINIVKYRSECFKGDPSTYINKKYDIRKIFLKNNSKSLLITYFGS